MTDVDELLRNIKRFNDRNRMEFGDYSSLEWAIQIIDRALPHLNNLNSLRSRVEELGGVPRYGGEEFVLKSEALKLIEGNGDG